MVPMASTLVQTAPKGDMARTVAEFLILSKFSSLDVSE